jgi:hypothetical protein
MVMTETRQYEYQYKQSPSTCEVPPVDLRPTRRSAQEAGCARSPICRASPRGSDSQLAQDVIDRDPFAVSKLAR